MILISHFLSIDLGVRPETVSAAPPCSVGLSDHGEGGESRQTPARGADDGPDEREGARKGPIFDSPIYQFIDSQIVLLIRPIAFD